MRERGWGRILTSTSGGALSPIPNLAISNTLRASLHTWSKTLADEVGRDGVTSNIIVPGRIETARTRFLDERRPNGRRQEQRRRDGGQRKDDGARPVRPPRGIRGRGGVPVQRPGVVRDRLRDPRRRRTAQERRLRACDSGHCGQTAPPASHWQTAGSHASTASSMAGRPICCRCWRPGHWIGWPTPSQRGVDDARLCRPESPVAAPWSRPRKILGIGLNYGAHAGDLGEQAPRTSPASFIKGDHTIVGAGRADRGAAPASGASPRKRSWVLSSDAPAIASESTTR